MCLGALVLLWVAAVRCLVSVRVVSVGWVLLVCGICNWLCTGGFCCFALGCWFVGFEFSVWVLVIWGLVNS